MVVQAMTKEDFDNVPYRSHRNFYGEFSSLVIIPDDSMLESGFRCMTFVLVDSDCEPICKISAGSDVLSIDGIGGYGLHKYGEDCPDSIKPKAWSIDCLSCGYLRLFSNYKLKIDDLVGSNCGVYSIYPEGR